MNSIISLFGLNQRQKWLAQQLWICETLDEVADLRDSIDEDMWQDLFVVMELIFLADVDSVVDSKEDCAEAIEILERIRDEPII
jgi:hypothetical protein